MKVLKFGGSSVANAEHIRRVGRIVEGYREASLVVVVSALGGVTDLLLQALDEAAAKNPGFRSILNLISERHELTIEGLFTPPLKEEQTAVLDSAVKDLQTLLEGAFLIGESTPRLRDKVAGYGELLSAGLITGYLKQLGLDASYKDARELIRTDRGFGKAMVDSEESSHLSRSYFDRRKERLTVVPGFIGSSPEGDLTTLGRGGSDYTAAIIAAALSVEDLEIWTDVNGMYTADPRLVKQARCLSNLSYEEAMELSHFGASVLYPPTIQPVLEKGFPIWIRNTFDPDQPGTCIQKEPAEGRRTITGISHIDAIALLALEGPEMVGMPGISRRFFEAMSLESVNIVLITQASSEHSICVGVPEEDADRAAQAVNRIFAHEISGRRLKEVVPETGLSIVALVGDQLRSHQGISGRMFSTLGKNNVNIKAIAQGSSERNISAVIASRDVRKALNSLHESFFEESFRQLNLYVMGVGNVGSRLLEQLRMQQSYLKESLRLNLRVVAIANSSSMHFDPDGIDLSRWRESLEQGSESGIEAFFRLAVDQNLRNSIYVDNTASEKAASMYEEYLKHSVAVVTCNKIACSSELDRYRELKRISRKYSAPFLYETNVGAGLPVIDTLKNLIASGDRIHKIQAVLSGSLNFIWNTYDAQRTFSEVVREAIEGGYTEPDPKIDLSGIDVMRKILILARESGSELELQDIQNFSFLPEGSLQTAGTEEFLARLLEQESFFRKRLDEARAARCSLKYVAEYSEGAAQVGLRAIPPGHPFFKLEGSDNIVLFFTDRYPERPLMVKGAGAGAEVTASGLFADLIRVGNS